MRAPSDSASPGRRVGAADDGDDLAAAAEQPGDHLDGDLLEVGADDDDVAGHGARGRRRARSGPALVRACLLAIATAPCRVAAAAWLICAALREAEADGVEHRERGQPLHRGPRAHDVQGDALLLGRAGSGLGGHHRVAVVGQHDHLERVRGPRGVEQLARRRAPARPAGTTTCAPASSNTSASPGPARAARRRPRRGGRLRDRLDADLVSEVGHPHPVGTAGVDPRLDRGADVVDVDVDVPEVGPADDEQRVAEPVERRRERGHALLVAVAQQVHDLVCRSAQDEVALAGRAIHRWRPIGATTPPTWLQSSRRRIESSAKTSMRSPTWVPSWCTTRARASRSRR